MSEVKSSELRATVLDGVSSYACELLSGGRTWWQLRQDQALAERLARGDLESGDMEVIDKRTGKLVTSSQIQKAVLNTAARRRLQPTIIQFV